MSALESRHSRLRFDCPLSATRGSRALPAGTHDARNSCSQQHSPSYHTTSVILGHFTFSTGGIAQVPSIAVLRGEYSRAWRENGWAGVGSQFDSLSAPGFSLWR